MAAVPHTQEMVPPFLAALSSSIGYLVPQSVSQSVSRFVEIVTPAYLYWPLLTFD